jgi:hypothetical protein
MSSGRSNCDEKGTLLIAYAQAARAYSQAVADLTRAVGMISEAEYELLKRKAVEARELSDGCRQRLEQHVDEHCC